MAYEIDELQAHVMELVCTHRLNLSWSDGISGHAIVPTRSVKIPPVESYVAYAIALHEIGHVVGAQGLGHEREQLAWEWAIGHALTWTDEMQGHKDRSLAGYRNVGRTYEIRINNTRARLGWWEAKLYVNGEAISPACEGATRFGVLTRLLSQVSHVLDLRITGVVNGD